MRSVETKSIRKKPKKKSTKKIAKFFYVTLICLFLSILNIIAVFDVNGSGGIASELFRNISYWAFGETDKLYAVSFLFCSIYALTQLSRKKISLNIVGIFFLLMLISSVLAVDEYSPFTRNERGLANIGAINIIFHYLTVRIWGRTGNFILVVFFALKTILFFAGYTMFDFFALLNRQAGKLFEKVRSIELLDVNFFEEEQEEGYNELQNFFYKQELPATLINIEELGSTVKYIVELGNKLKISKLKSYSEDIANVLRVQQVSIYPESGYVVIQHGTKQKTLLNADDFLESPEFKNTDDFSYVLGTNLNNDEMVFSSLLTDFHLLIGGKSRFGKSNLLNLVIISLIAKHPPKDLKFVLIDKHTALNKYKNLPHCLYDEVADTPEQAESYVNNLTQETKRRLDMFKDLNVSKLEEYNTKSSSKLPRIVVVIDELLGLAKVGDSLMTKLLEGLREAGKAGIHFIFAVQDAKADSIPTTLTNNTQGICLKVNSGYASKAIIGQSGAETLTAPGQLKFVGQATSYDINATIQSPECTEPIINKALSKYKGKNKNDKIIDLRHVRPGISPNKDDTFSIVEYLLSRNENPSFRNIQKASISGLTAREKIKTAIEKMNAMGILDKQPNGSYMFNITLEEWHKKKEMGTGQA